jgi:hypothetical protein
LNILAVLPMAFVMVAGPQILSSSFFATREDWRRTSAAYVLGAAISISIIVTLAFLLSDGATSSGASDKSIYYIVLALLLYGMLHTFTTRKTAEPPKWMGRLESATPPVRLPTRLPPTRGLPERPHYFDLGWGLLERLRRPALARALGFIGLTLLLLGSPALAVMNMGERAERVLPKVRDWMNANSWIVNELVLLLFVGIVIGNIAG